MNKKSIEQEAEELKKGDKVKIAWWDGDITTDTVAAVNGDIVTLEKDYWTWKQLITERL